MTQLSTSQMPSSGPVTTQRSPSLSLRVGARQFGRGVTGTLNPLQLAEQSVNTSKANDILEALGAAQAGAAGLGRYLTQGKLDQERDEAKLQRERDRLTRDHRAAVAEYEKQRKKDATLAQRAGAAGEPPPEDMVPEVHAAYYRALGGQRAIAASSKLMEDIASGEIEWNPNDPEEAADLITSVLVSEDTPGSELINQEIRTLLTYNLAKAAGAVINENRERLAIDGINGNLARLSGNIERQDMDGTISSIDDVLLISKNAKELFPAGFQRILPYLEVLAKTFKPVGGGAAAVGVSPTTPPVLGNKFFYEVLDRLPEEFETLMPKEYRSLIRTAVIAERNILVNELKNDIITDLTEVAPGEDRDKVIKNYVNTINLRSGFGNLEPEHITADQRAELLRGVNYKTEADVLSREVRDAIRLLLPGGLDNTGN